VDEYLSEKEQIERIREWWRENGWYLVGGIALGALALFGWNRYQHYVDTRGEQAAALYAQVRDALADDNRESAQRLLGQLREDYASSPYTDQAGLMLARAFLVSDTSKAAEELRYVMEHTDDHELGLIARLRLARVLIYQKQDRQALNLLAVDDPGQFAARISEIRGDAYVALKDTEAARTAYTSALTAPGSDWLNRNFLEMKLDALGSPQQAADVEGAPGGGSGAEAGSTPGGGSGAEAGSAPGSGSGAEAGSAPGSGSGTEAGDAPGAEAGA
jgi:predicted negative regulator of RcsB-dependent stress response